ncbi:MAG: chromosome segregation protein SMC [Pseudomonadales bacterium]|nr:chromosome segregation protein SMC [Pseudomonadales bacterium]
MRLKCIKLAGFKSFVDPTTVNLPTNLTAIVGPNGCGKSNVIDAVRWVMGESSAKHLRGESMTDVIFNGSNARKPVAQAFIELVFDNSEGRLGGEYAQYTEISIKRLVTREGQSNYFFNGTKCRRKDITDLFMGTGLGPRSYSIIEQGMISRLVEAKPEELRIFIEEAAGISKYKERRRETENRMRRTRENLERLEDIRDELGRQLQHLHRQSESAEKYKEFREEERLYKAQLQAMRWTRIGNQVGSKESLIRDLEIKLEACLTDRVSKETEIEKHRSEHADLSDKFSSVQERFYGVGTDIARAEQNIQHQKELHKQLHQDLVQSEQSHREALEHLNTDETKLEELTLELDTIQPELELVQATEEESGQALANAEEAMQSWQSDWDSFNQKAAEPKERAQVEQSRILHLEQSVQRSRDRVQRLTNERETLTAQPLEEEANDIAEDMAEVEIEVETLQGKVDELIDQIKLQRDVNSDASAELDQLRGNIQEMKGRFASLQALQQAALGQKNEAIVDWLKSSDLANNSRLAEGLQVSGGWETAVEMVLGGHLQAVCVSDLDAAGLALGNLASGAISIIEKLKGAASVQSIVDLEKMGLRETGGPEMSSVQLMSEVVDADCDVSALLAGVYLKDTLDEALALRSQLTTDQSIVTKAGIWIGSNWIKVAKDVDENAGVIQRQHEIEELEPEIEMVQARINLLSDELKAGREHLSEREQQREAAQKEVSQTSRALGELRSQHSAKCVRLEQIAMRRDRLETELRECEDQVSQEQEILGEARIILQDSLDAMADDTERREELLAKRDENRSILDEVRQSARQDKDKSHQLALQAQSLVTQMDSTSLGLERLRGQVGSLKERVELLKEKSANNDDPIELIEAQLEELLIKRAIVEDELGKARRKLEEVDHEMRRLEKLRSEADESAQSVRGQLESLRMEWQGLKVNLKNVEDQLAEGSFEVEEVVASMPEEANEEDWEKTIEKIANRITRLGAINLAAIDEYKQQSERKTYLDEQNEDLITALETLENAIRKIDRETRTRFKETFDKVNGGLQDLFPRVFGGGHAYLELTGDDMLDTGVAIMARPPGKRNSTIHLLSGGEKALTAIALVFSIFQLNPAPFCMLDEVDAPLDDANVGRYSRMVEEMSAKVQFIYITHNKIAMEMAKQLMGVTMHEAGVSRLVSVDVEQAVDLAVM